ncbi:MAG: DUF4249 domain-containing protein [Bacteroidia bacterium]|jgi:hypothetical protein|nr:DUF4249 domain-containing protein [Bacteroidia bacterium]
MEYQILKQRWFIFGILSNLLLLSLTGCDKLADDVEPPKVPSKLVLFAFLSPEEPLVKVEVSRSRPIFGKQTPGNPYGYIADAIVTIINQNGQTVNMPYVDSVSAYLVDQNQFPIEPGQTYKVIAQRGNDLVTGETTVPVLKPAFTSVTYQNIAVPDPNGSYFGPAYIYTYKWQDEPAKGNFYRVSVDSRIFSLIFKGPNDFDSTESYYNICNSIWEDATQNGQQLTGTCEDYTYYGIEGDTIDFTLLNTDIHYAEYHKRRLNYFGEDPFSEPVQQYSNVSTGLGVVSSFRKSTQRVLVK